MKEVDSFINEFHYYISKYEMITDHILKEKCIENICDIDDESLLCSLDSLIARNKDLKAMADLQKELLNASEDNEIVKLAEKKFKLQESLKLLQTYRKYNFIDIIRERKDFIIEESLKSVAKSIQNKENVTKEEIDTKYSFFVRKYVKDTILEFLAHFGE